MSRTPKDTEQLTLAQKRALLEQALKKKAKAESKRAPLSFAQQRLWFLEQMEPGTSSYNIPLFLRFEGPMHAEALEKSIGELILRHEVLRTTFGEEKGEPYQLIASKLKFKLQVLDAAGGEEEAKRLADLEARTPFDLTTGPLLRASLLRLGEEDHILLFNMHHIISDGWSMGILLHELLTVYQAFVQNETPSLAPLSVQYADFAKWQQSRVGGAALDSQLDYWKKQLGDAPPVLELPADRPRPPVQSYRGDNVAFTISQGVTEKLKKLSQQEEATLFMTLLTAFQTYLSRLSGQTDISVGTPMAGRSRPEIQGLIGFFVNTLVMRTDLSDRPAFRAALRRVREVSLEAYAHQELPFDKIVEELSPERHLSHSPLFQVMFTMQNSSFEKQTFGDTTLSVFNFDSVVAKFDLTLTMTESPEGLSANIEYSTDLFDRSTIERMAGQLTCLLEAIAGDADQAIDHLPLLNSAAQEQLLAWGGEPTPYPRESSMQAVFEAQAEGTPDATALVFGEQKLTYRELNEKANRLAHHLRRKGVETGHLVGISMERSLEMIIGLLGILKAGGAYVPLDPNYPHDRLTYMLEDTGVSVLLTQTHLLEKLPQHGAQTLCLDQEQFLDEPAENQSAQGLSGTGDDLAYVIYTSGSTGQPKGVLVPHRGVVRMVKDTNYADFSADNVFLQLSTISFDAATFEIWGALLNGAALAIMPPHTPSLEELAEQITFNGVTTLFLTTALFMQMTDHQVEALRSVRQLFTGGDVVPVHHAEKVRGIAGLQLFNVYGPTESTTYTTFYPVPKTAKLGASLPIGRPIANTEVYVLDENGQLVPIGVPGELCIGGDGLAVGYLNRPEQTLSAFVQHEKGRLYRTGDLVRWLPDGNLDFMGRLDNQVKLRGYRIELGEVEAALLQHRSVLETVVIVSEIAPGDKRLIAYVVCDSKQQAPNAAELREHMQSGLPSYMVPSAFVHLDALPLTSNGKIDKRALPAPALQDLASNEYEAPRNETEREVVRIFEEVLRAERIGIHDDFFAAGGHSLLATQAVSRLKEAFGLELPLRTLFEHPTASQLAQGIHKMLGITSESVSEKITAKEREGDPLPLSFAQQRLWFLDRLMPDSALYNIPLALRLRGDLQETPLRQALTEIVSRHEALRTTFVEADGEAVQVIHPAGEVELPLADLTKWSVAEREAKAKEYVEQEARRPFSLTQGPLVRFQLVKLAGDDHLLVINMHHIVSDGWSMGIFLGELTTLYRCYAASETPVLPELPVQYADYAVWQREQLTDAALEAQINYWIDTLSDAPPVLQLPTDRPRPAVPTHRGAWFELDVEQETAEKLQALSKETGSTMFMVLLAAFSALLSRWSAQPDICVGTPVAGRNRQEIEGLIGFFVNTLVLRTDLSGSPSFRDLLTQVRNGALDAFANQDVPFEKVVEEVGVERSLSYTPLFQVMFSTQSATEGPGGQELPGLALEMFEFATKEAKFDITLTVTELKEGLRASFEYSTDLFDEPTIRRLAEHYSTLLRAVVAAPEHPVGKIRLTTDEEEHQLLAWKGDGIGHRREDAIHTLFEEHVASRPDRIALMFGEKTMTYRELNEEANRLARLLQQNGVRKGDLVGIEAERSFEMVIGLVAISKAGAAYVPLDPHYPPDRLAHMIETTQVSVLLTQPHLLEKLPPHNAQILFLEREAWADLPAENLNEEVTGGDVSHVIFTSGSTGKPKGNLIPHRGVVRLVKETNFADFSDDNVFMQIATISFDAATFEIWGTLLNGARIAIMQPHPPSLDELGRAIAKYGVTTMWFTSGLFTQMVDRNLEALKPLRQLLVGGDVVSVPHVEKVRSIGVPVINGYGPTESTTFTCCYPVPMEEPIIGTLSIGTPIAGTEVYVLDSHLELAPIGVPGELYIGGDGLALGYLNRPDLTAERFITHEKGRLYRTGDLVRWLPSGILEFFGRIDNQVKLRGFRIELGEIEAVLAKHPNLSDCVVIVREDRPGHKYLIAYCVVSEQTDLREFLKQQLPEYMVPSFFVYMDELPLTPNGKINKRVLPEPDILADTELVPLRTPAEELVASVFAKVLHVNGGISAAHNFFEIGGHSLLATQAISRLSKAFGTDLPLRILFEAPTVSELAALIEEQTGVEQVKIVQVPRGEGTLSASYAQQRLWFLDRLLPGSSVYNMPMTVRLQGELDEAALVHSLELIVSRHESLRTTFAEVEGVAVQVIADEFELAFEKVDLSHLPLQDAEKEALQLVEADARHPYDLANGPMLRAALIRLSEQDAIFLLNMHHIVSDGWSMGVLLKEWAELYTASVSGTEAVLPQLPIQYADFAVWQREWLAGDVLQKQVDYWKTQLGGELPVLQLPTDRPRTAERSHRGALHSISLDAALCDALRTLSREEDATLFMTLLAAYQTLLYRYSAQDDITVGSPIAGRNREELEELIGFFVNTLVFRTDLSGQPSFRELVSRVRETALGAFAHQDLPFEKVVEEVQPERSLTHNPLFQTMFVFQNIPTHQGDTSLPGLTMQAFEYEQVIAKFDLTLVMAEGQNGMTATFEYNTDLFDAGTIERMAEHFKRLLGTLAAQPDWSIDRPKLLSPAEEQLLLSWSGHVSEVAQDCIHHLFEAQAAQIPEHIALVFDGQEMSYRELNEQANRLAHRLQHLGVGPEVRVALSAERSFELIVAMLAILKAGGAYVPLDPTYPQERLDYILQDSGAALLLTQEHLLERWKEQATPRFVIAKEVTAGESLFNLQSDVTPDNLAYIIYTSGSTGLPKGVLIEHRGIANMAYEQAQAMGLGEDDRMLQFASFSFDAAVSEIFMALLSGASLQLASADVLLPGPDLVKLLQEQNVTAAVLSPSVLAVLSGEELPAMRTVISAGEAISAELAAHWSQGRRLLNAYGPTEATVCATLAVIEEGMEAVTIGQPIANKEILLLDAHGNLVPIGVPGELCIGGLGLARGYLNRPELNEERFIAHPFSTQPGAKLYRSGDLARFLADGSIEYLGRIDHQVKIRGFRIEPGEIEAALTQYPHVREALVLAVEDRTAGKRLVAYVVADADADAELNGDVSALRSHLKAQLPEHMVPSAFVLLDSMPLTPNGKVDRKALPAPDNAASGLTYTAPRTPTEELMTGILARVLGEDRLGIHDNFFERGGHSLLATQVISRIRDTFSVELPLRTLFAAPTAAELSGAVEAELRDGSAQALQKIPRAERETGLQLPLSHAQQRLWFLDRLMPESAVYNMPMAVRLQGELNEDALVHSLTSIVRRHEALRTTFAEVEGVAVQVIAEEFELAFEKFDLSHLPAQEAEQKALQLVEADARRPYDLARGPLIRSALIRVTGQEAIFLLNMHHIVSDGWSMGVLLQEWATLYAAFVEGTEADLPQLPIQYADFALWQREWLNGDVLQKQVDYWKMQLGGELPVLQLPTDRPRTAERSHRGAVHGIALDPKLSQALRTLSREEDATLFMTLLAAYQTLLYRYSGQEDITVGSPIAGRNREELEALIGFFVNTLVFRTDLSGNPTFRELIARVRETAFAAYAHQDLPFEKVVEEVQPERSLTHNPLFQTMFVWQNIPAARSDSGMPGLHLQPFEYEQVIAKFDLTLVMAEGIDGLTATFEYNTDLFDAVTIERMAEHFRSLLEALANEPQQTIDRPKLLTQAEEQQLFAWSGQVREVAQDCMHHLFEQQAERMPEKTALVFGGQTLSYRELNEQANALAHHLQKLGVGPEVRVALSAERSFDLIIAMLGILKAGGAYVPLDPTYPQERLDYILQDSGAALLLTQEHLLARWNEQAPPRFCIGQGAEAGESRSNVESAVTPDNLAYVIYTSGSTGLPKGVEIEHRGVANMAYEQAQAMGLGEDDHMLQFASFSFDAAVSEIFMALLSGASLQLASADELLPGAGLGQLLTEQKVTAAVLSPSVLAVLSDEELPDLRTVISAGEAISAELAAHWSQGRRLLNAYGPTEATVCATLAVMEEGMEAVTIGRPIANKEILILDANGHLVPIGVPGELCIGGLGLARGYLNRPELTEERFVTHPFSAQPGAKLYRSGDLARFLADGSIEYLGRIDHQVKIRGFRIEPGEIEAALTSHPHVREALVLAREDRHFGQRLVAYVVAESELDGAAAVLRSHLKAQLPEHMVPSAFVLLDSMPLTPNGKVDRKALPAPDDAGSSLTYTAPRTPTEELMTGILAQVLGTERIGIHDNFFERGGHSLLATGVISRIRDTFAVELPLRTLFATPTAAELSAEVEAALQNGTDPSALKIEPADRSSGHMPLSYNQQRLWFLENLMPGSAAYNIPSALRLRGDLQEGALIDSFNAVIERHESLRTTFRDLEGEGVQVIGVGQTISLTRLDLRDHPSAAREQEAHRLAEAEAGQPFDLTAGPLLRAVLAQLDDDDHLLLLNMHHSISDGWSMNIFHSEWLAFYSAFAKGNQLNLPPLSIQYADYASWQRSRLQGAALIEQTAYWKKQLSGAEPFLRLPTDRPRPAVQTFRGSVHSMLLPQELAAAMQNLSRESGTTLFMTLLAAFQTFLSRLSGQSDITVGSPVAGRSHRELEGLIGFFVNTLVFRTDLSGSPTFRELLARVRETALGAYAHQDLPFEKVVEEVQPERSMSHSPLFQVMFVLQNTPQQGNAEDLAGLVIEPFGFEHTSAKFDLTLTMAESAEGLLASFEYNTDLFDRESVERMADQFRLLLEGIAQNAEQPIHTLSMLTVAEAQALQDWNSTQADYRSDALVHERFAEQAARTPHDVAVHSSTVTMTYAELDAASNRLARYLRQIGVGADVPVGIFLERSPEMVIAVLAVLKAGGAYVPLEPNHPQDRLQYILEDAGVKLVLTSTDLCDQLPVQTLTKLLLDEADSLWTKESAEPLPRLAAPDDLAYLIYTSGSTGRPKGVMVRHQGLTNYLSFGQQHYRTHEGTGAPLHSPLSFDLTVTSLYLPLLSGKTVYIVPDGIGVDNLKAAMQEHGTFSFVKLTPAHLQLLTESLTTEEMDGLTRALIIGGEALHYELLLPWQEHAPATRLINEYGPTETVVGCSVAEVAPGDRKQGIVPIGRPIQNTELYVLDTALQPVPLGAVGELYIGGDGVARGYLNMAELTAERFLPHPFAENAQARLYKTGDLARYLQDGTLEYLGRSDDQIKLRGYRIELGEIEEVILRHPAVQQSAVVLREVTPGDTRLVGYAECKAGEALQVSDLQAFVKGMLPDYMVPSAFVLLDSMPLTTNGKVDRKALPLPESFGTGAQTDYLPPRNSVERKLVQIWQELLGVPQVGVRDNFFALGGHSLLAMRLTAEIEKQFGCKLPLAGFYQEGTIEGLAALLQQASAQPSYEHLVLLNEGEADKQPLFLVHPVGGSVHSYLPLSRELSGQPLYGLQARGLEDDHEPYATVEEMAAAYLQEVRDVQPHGPYHLGGWSIGGVIAYEMARLLQEAGEEVALLTLLDTYMPQASGISEADIPEAELVTGFARTFAESFGVLLGEQELIALFTQIQAEAEANALRTVLAQPWCQGKLPPGFTEQEVSRMYSVYKANFQGVRRFHPQVLSVRTVLFRAAEGAAAMTKDETLGWSGLISRLDSFEVPGSHATMILPPNATLLAERLRQELSSYSVTF